MIKRKEVAVRNNPGISKIFEWRPPERKWIDTGKFRAVRRTPSQGGGSKKESVFFDNFEQAKAFRLGKISKHETGKHHKNIDDDVNGGTRFAKLVQDWKEFHFLTVDFTTRQTYQKRIPALDFLLRFYVEEIDAQVIDRLIHYWHTEYPSSQTRFSFEKELDTLKVILNFYRRRINPRYLLPVFREHYQAAIIVKRAKQPVRSLKPDDLGKFLLALKAQKNPVYFRLALTQFGLGLRIGEACGLHWEAIDFENRIVKIERTVIWDQENWQPSIKMRPKNGRVRFLVMPEILAEELMRLRSTCDGRVELVFHDRGQPLIRKTIGKAYKRALDLCGIDYVSGTHLIRKTSATQANRITGDFHAVSVNLGHSSLDETQKYVEEVDEGKRKVARALDQVARTVLQIGERGLRDSEKEGVG